MKKIMQVTEVEGEGLVSLLGEPVWVWCARYIYAGTLTGVNDKDICLENARIVYETGPLTGDKFKDSQALPPGNFYIRIDAIESYAVRKVSL